MTQQCVSLWGIISLESHHAICPAHPEISWAATDLSTLFFCAYFGCTDFAGGWTFTAVAVGTEGGTAGAVVVGRSQFCTCRPTHTSTDDVIKKFQVISKYTNKVRQMKPEHQNIGLSRIILRFVGQIIYESSSENRRSYRNIWSIWSLWL